MVITPPYVCVLPRVRRAHALVRTLGRMRQLRYTYRDARPHPPRVNPRACVMVVLCAPRMCPVVLGHPRALSAASGYQSALVARKCMYESNLWASAPETLETELS